MGELQNCGQMPILRRAQARRVCIGILLGQSLATGEILHTRRLA